MAFEESVNILLVDDHPENLLALEAILQDLGQNLVKAHSGKEALRELLAYEFAVILMDVHMPEMDGFETAALIRQREKLQHTPIIFLTAMDKNDSSVFKGYSVGAVDYIFKPFSPDILRAKVGVFIDLFKKTREVKRQAELLRDINRELGMTNKAIGGLYNQLEAKNIEIRTERDFVNAILDTAGSAVMVLDASGRIVRANRTAEEMSGYPDHEARGKVLWEFFKGEDAERGKHMLERLRVADAPISEEKSWLHRNGEEIRVVMTFTALRDHDGELTNIIATGVDISERQRAEEKVRRMNEDLEERVRQRTSQLQKTNQALQQAKEQAEQANRAKDQFLAVLSHELRTPLTPVLSIVQVLEEDPDLSPDLQQWIQTIRRNIELEARLIDDLLDITRIANGKIQLNMEPVNVHALVKTVIEICNNDIRQKDIDLHVDLSAKRHTVRGDPARLQQVIWNLLKNAVKFTPPKGKIKIETVDTDDQHLAISVVDSGIGIQKDVLGRIFNAFEQGDQEITRQFGGLGLGLAITKAMVEAHGGQIRAHSDGKDKGAVFTVVLESQETSVGHPSLHQVQSRNGHATRSRILLVEDNLDTSKVMQVLLERRGFSVSIAGTFAEALECARREAFDLVISDIGLPDGSGLDLMKAMNAIRPVRGIALSGLGMEDDIKKSLAAGFELHLVKPINFELLNEAVVKILSSENVSA